jgi:hypothetical protein
MQILNARVRTLSVIESDLVQLKAVLKPAAPRS